MTRVTKVMPSPESATAGNTATFNLPIGRRYHCFHLAYSATAIAPSDFSEIRVMCNNKPIQRFTGTERNDLNKHDGLADAAIDAASGILRIPFDRVGLLNRAAEEETSINTGSEDANGIAIRQFSLEIDLASGITGTISLILSAEQSESIPGGAGTVPYILRTTMDITGAVVEEITNLPRGSSVSMAMERVFFKYSENDISQVELEINERSVWKRTKAVNNRILSDGVRVPQAGYFAMDRTEWGYGADVIGLTKGIEDMRYKVTSTGTLSLVILAHYWGKIID